MPLSYYFELKQFIAPHCLWQCFLSPYEIPFRGSNDGNPSAGANYRPQSRHIWPPLSHSLHRGFDDMRRGQSGSIIIIRNCEKSAESESKSEYEYENSAVALTRFWCCSRRQSEAITTHRIYSIHMYRYGHQTDGSHEAANSLSTHPADRRCRLRLVAGNATLIADQSLIVANYEEKWRMQKGQAEPQSRWA